MPIRTNELQMAPLPAELVAPQPPLSGRALAERITAERRAQLRRQISTYFDKLVPGRRRVLEIGCGHGHFLTAYACAFPDHDCLGIDYSRERIEKARRKVERNRVANAHFLLGAVQDLLAVLPDTLKFDRVFILFPDPWPKRRHRKNRLMQPPFLDQLATFVRAGGELFFRTDHEEYFAQARSVVAEHPQWRLLTDFAWPFEHPTVFQERTPTHHSFAAVRTSPARQ